MRGLADHGRAIGSPAALREARDVLPDVVGCSRATMRTGDLAAVPGALPANARRSARAFS